LSHFNNERDRFAVSSGDLFQVVVFRVVTLRSDVGYERFGDRWKYQVLKLNMEILHY